jgi:hypothetical protein
MKAQKPCSTSNKMIRTGLSVLADTTPHLNLLPELAGQTLGPILHLRVLSVEQKYLLYLRPSKNTLIVAERRKKETKERAWVVARVVNPRGKARCPGGRDAPDPIEPR